MKRGIKLGAAGAAMAGAQRIGAVSHELSAEPTESESEPDIESSLAQRFESPSGAVSNKRALNDGDDRVMKRFKSGDGLLSSALVQTPSMGNLIRKLDADEDDGTAFVQSSSNLPLGTRGKYLPLGTRGKGRNCVIIRHVELDYDDFEEDSPDIGSGYQYTVQFDDDGKTATALKSEFSKSKDKPEVWVSDKTGPKFQRLLNGHDGRTGLNKNMGMDEYLRGSRPGGWLLKSYQDIDKIRYHYVDPRGLVSYDRNDNVDWTSVVSFTTKKRESYRINLKDRFTIGTFGNFKFPDKIVKAPGLASKRNEAAIKYLRGSRPGGWLLKTDKDIDLIETAGGFEEYAQDKNIDWSAVKSFVTKSKKRAPKFTRIEVGEEDDDSYPNMREGGNFNDMEGAAAGEMDEEDDEAFLGDGHRGSAMPGMSEGGDFDDMAGAARAAAAGNGINLEAAQKGAQHSAKRDAARRHAAQQAASMKRIHEGI